MNRIEPDLRAQLARVFGAGEDEVALTHSTSEGISIVAWSLDWKPGDEVVISNTEHPANVIPWYVLRDRFGIAIREIDLSPGTDLVGEVERQLSETTRMVSLSHVSRNNGRTLRTEDSARLAALLRARSIRYHLDGAQGPGCVATDFAALGCDCYSTCGHKWLLGPKGTGALFVRRGNARRGSVELGRSAQPRDHGLRRATTRSSRARRATSSGRGRLPTSSGFGQAVQWMEDIGFERILKRIDELVDHGIEAIHADTGTLVGFAGAPGGPFGDPGGPAAGGVVTRGRSTGTSPGRTASWRHRSAASVTSALSIHFFNTREEISSALEAIVSRCA